MLSASVRLSIGAPDRQLLPIQHWAVLELEHPGFPRDGVALGRPSPQEVHSENQCVLQASFRTVYNRPDCVIFIT